MKLNRTLVISLMIFVLLSCGKDAPGGVNATLTNIASIDGCGWVLQLDDSSRLEPLNLRDFDIELQQGKKVKIEYKETGAMSVCMVGKVVELTSLKE